MMGADAPIPGGSSPPGHHQEHQTPDFELTLPARAENVAVVRHAFGGLGEALDVPDHALADVKLAVTEACTNVVVHAYGEDEGPMAVSAQLRDGRLTVVVADEGRGILPRPIQGTMTCDAAGSFGFRSGLTTATDGRRARGRIALELTNCDGGENGAQRARS